MCTSHRSQHFCSILPPHILLNVAKNGDQDQRNFALQTLAVDHSLRTTRLTYSLLGGLTVPHPTLAAGEPAVQRTIYDAKQTQSLPGDMVRSEGQAEVGDAAVNQSYDGLGETFNFYLDVYQRNSVDNAGLPLKATVHFGVKYDNAFWNGQQMVFGDGDGVIFNSFTSSVDIIGHELTHGVTGSEANLNYQGQPGALNESISDVFGSLIKQYVKKQTAEQADWLIGDQLLAKGIKGVALRSMKAPGTAYDDPVLGKDEQPANMQNYVQTVEDNGGVHINSGIPNHVFYLVASSLGGYAWEKAGQIWYDTVTDTRLKKNATFASFANLTVLNASRRYGAGSVEQKAVSEAWSQVGVKLASSSMTKR